MDKIGDVEIRIEDLGDHTLSPDTYDIKHIQSLLKNIEYLLYPEQKKSRPPIYYDIQSGSVRNIFKTNMQAVIAFSALLSQVEVHQSIDFLDIKTAKAFEELQNLSIQKNYSVQIKTSLKEDYELEIKPDSKFFRNEGVLVDGEFYFYGTLTNAGGKSKANIHLDTSEYGTLTIDTGKIFLAEQKENLLYKKYGVNVSGKQDATTGEIDTTSLKLINLIDYDTEFNESYLNGLISKANKNWKGVDAEEWLGSLRGGYEVEA